MESKIAQALRLKYSPVAILWSDHKPQKSVGFREGKWGCVVWMLAAAAKGKTAAFDKNTYGCWGGGVGLGFGNQYLHFPGGIECFHYFLSTGNDAWPQGRKVAEKLEGNVGADFLEEFRHGECRIGDAVNLLTLSLTERSNPGSGHACQGDHA